MLQSIRDRLTGPIVWFVIGLICIPFAFWGIESFRTDGGDPVVAQVGDQEITQAQFRAGYEQRYRQLQQLLGENFSPDMIDQARLRQNVLDDMVQESVMRQYTREAGYRASDAAVFGYLSSIPQFQQDGKFSAQIYKDLLARQGMQPQRFESQLRESLVIDQLRESVVDSAFVTPAEAQLAYRISAQSRDVAVAVVSADKFRDQVSVSQEQIAQRYEEQKSRFKAAERIRLAYVELDLAALPPAQNPGAEVLKVMYDAEKDSRFSTAEERKARHILVSFGADKSAAKRKIEQIAAQLKGGADFAEIARAQSDDTGSRQAGGDLGWVRRGMMTASFEEALFGLPQGQLSEPVETEFGWHLIRVDEIRQPTVKSFDDPEVQSALLALFQAREAEKRFQELSEKLEQLAFENPAALEPVAQALGLQVKTTDWFTRDSGTGIAAQDAVRQAAFSGEVLDDNENSRPLPIGENRIAVVRKAEYEAPRQRTLEEVAETIRSELQAEAAKAQAALKAGQLMTALAGNEPLAEAAAASGAEIVHDGSLKRDSTAVDRAIVEAVFRLPRPADHQPQLRQVDLANGDIAVVALRKVEDPAAEAGGAQSETARLRDAVAGAEFLALREAIEKRVKVQIKNPPADEPAAGEELP